MSPRRVERIGLIGLGKHGLRYARHITGELPDLALVAVARRDAAQLEAARAFGAEGFADYRAMIERARLDAVIAVVPPTLHLDIVRAAAAAGLPLLLEKPAAPTLADGRAMLAFLRSQPIPVMVAQTLRYNGVVRALTAALPRVGRVRSLSFTQRFEPSPLDWLDDPARSGGGMTLHTGVHAFDLCRRLSGLEADRVSCQMQAIRTRRTEDNFAATIALGGGAALATVACARVAGGRNGHIEVAGESATLLGDHVLGTASLVVGNTVEPLPVAAAVATVREVVRDFVAALRAGAPPPIPLAEGLRAIAIVDACYAAARAGRVADVEPLAA
ncbi:Gfo/Idh/MocA family oxidoreductase [bacterium]|nr:Gfo/Idh/MocA family oxidoreductase [bacterium]